MSVAEVQKRMKQPTMSLLKLVLETQVVGAYSAKKYVITDPVDMDQTMFNYMLRCSERQLAVVSGLKDAGRFYQECKIAQTQALEWDNRFIEDLSNGITPYWLGSNYTITLSNE